MNLIWKNKKKTWPIVSLLFVDEILSKRSVNQSVLMFWHMHMIHDVVCLLNNRWMNEGYTGLYACVYTIIASQKHIKDSFNFFFDFSEIFFLEFINYQIMYILHMCTLYDSLFFNSCIFFSSRKKNTNNNNNNNGRKFVRFYYYYYYEIWYMIRYCECPVEYTSLAFKTTTTIIITIYPGVIFCCHLDIYPQVTHSKSSNFFLILLLCMLIFNQNILED